MARAVGPPNSYQAGSLASSNSRGLDDEQLLNAAAAAPSRGGSTCQPRPGAPCGAARVTSLTDGPSVEEEGNCTVAGGGGSSLSMVHEALSGPDPVAFEDLLEL